MKIVLVVLAVCLAAGIALPLNENEQAPERFLAVTEAPLDEKIQSFDEDTVSRDAREFTLGGFAQGIISGIFKGRRRRDVSPNSLVEANPGGLESNLNRETRFGAFGLGNTVGIMVGNLINGLGRKRRDVSTPPEAGLNLEKRAPATHVTVAVNKAKPTTTTTSTTTTTTTTTPAPTTVAPIDNIQEEQELGEVLSVPLYLRCGPFNLLACFFPQAFIV